VVVAHPVDLAVLKLGAHRDQDLVDIAVLAAIEDLSAEDIAAAAVADDIERSLAEGAVLARHAMQTGRFAVVFEELAARSPSEHELARFETLLLELRTRGV
jgi:hypothetical protein